MAKKEEFSYQDAITEIESILEKMENEELDVDILSFQIKRASQLIKLCREKLHKSEQEVEKILDEMEKEGHHIILMTARPESLRQELESCLRHHGIFWHQLIMGVTSGMRIVINDMKPDNEVSCQAWCILRNRGLGSCEL